MYEAGLLILQLALILVVGIIVADVLIESVSHEVEKRKLRYPRLAIIFLTPLAAIFALINIETKNEPDSLVLVSKVVSLSIGVAIRLGLKKWRQI